MPKPTRPSPRKPGRPASISRLMRRRWPGASQEVIAITLGLSQRHVSTLLADEVRRPRVLTVRALAVALGTSEEVIRAGFRHGAR